MRKTNKTKKTKTNNTVKTVKKSVKTKAITKKKSQPTKKPVVKTKAAAVKKAAIVKKAVVKKAIVKKAAVKKAVVKKAVAVKKQPKSVAKHVKPQAAPKGKVTHTAKKKVVKKTKTQPTAAKRAPVIQREAQPLTPQALHQKDLHILSNGFWGNLDLICFTQIALGNVTADVVYASDDVGIITKVLSLPGTWHVDTATDTWTNGQTEIVAPLNELKQFCASLKEKEPVGKLIPAIILMRGVIANEKEVEAYLNKHHVRLVKFDHSIQSPLPLLFQLLQENFQPILAPLDLMLEAEYDDADDNVPARQRQPRRHRKHSVALKLSKHLASNIATVVHTGYFPKASGTIGSLIALPIAYVLNQTSLAIMWAMILLTFIIGIWAIYHFTKNKVNKDPSSVIIDEVVGQSIPFGFVAPGLLHWPLLLTGFILFRFFDICKFGVVRYFDRQKNAWGVMMDDVVAGLQTAFILVLLQLWWLLT